MMDSAGNCTYNEYAPFGEDFLMPNGERYKFTGKKRMMVLPVCTTIMHDIMILLWVGLLVRM